MKSNNELGYIGPAKIDFS